MSYSWAMQLPEPGSGIEGSAFFTAFLPGNRDDQPRRPDGAIQQALVLMNDTTVMNRLVTTATNSPFMSLLTNVLSYTSNQDLVNEAYINILSRFPTVAENQAAAALLGSATGTARMQKAQELLWTLYNKVDFMFNY